MSFQFSVKDYLNYTISGVLWMGIIAYFLISLDIINKNDMVKYIQIVNYNILGFVIVFFGGFVFGNIFRFSDDFISWLTKILFGDPYKWALFKDKKVEKNKRKLGWVGNCLKSKNYCIAKKESEKIEEELKRLNLKRTNKKEQYIWVESFLSHQTINRKVERLNDLKNFYDSIFFPCFIFLIIILFETFRTNSISCLGEIVILIIVFIIFYKSIDRYRFLLSNYIKESYRSFLHENYLI